MPYGTVLSREQLINWLAGKSHNSLIAIREVGDIHVGPGQCLAVREDPSETPMRSGWIIAVQPRDMREFLAFVATYASSFSPFTAFFRVLSLPELSRHLDLSDNIARVPLELVALPIAESFIALDGRAKRLEEVSLSSVGGTLSWTFLESLSAGIVATAPAEIADRWVMARKRLTEADPHGASLTHVIDVWRIIFARYGRHSFKPRDEFEKLTIDAYGLAVEAGGLTEDLWRRLSAGAPAIAGAYSLMRGPREDRSRAMGQLFREIISEKGLAGHYRHCLAGALMALMAEGSFRYLPLATSGPVELPGMPLWFSLWSATFKATDVFDTGDCLGRHLAKRLPTYFDPFAPPTDDIAFDEFETKEAKEIAVLRTSQQSTISIEIAPYVSARFRRQPVARLERSPDGNQASAADLSELQTLARRLDTLARKFGGSSEPKDKRTGSNRTSGRRSRT